MNYIKKRLNRNLVVVSGTYENSSELHSAGTINSELADKLSNLLINGGIENISTTLKVINNIIDNKEIDTNKIEITI